MVIHEDGQDEESYLIESFAAWSPKDETPSLYIGDMRYDSLSAAAEDDRINASEEELLDVLSGPIAYADGGELLEDGEEEIRDVPELSERGKKIYESMTGKSS